MPLDTKTGVYFTLHGPPSGAPLLIGLPLMASHVEIFGPESAAVLEGYLDRLTDRYRVLLIDYPSIGGSRDIPPEQLTAERVCADLLGVATAAGFDQFAYWGYSWGGAVGLQLAARTSRLTALVIGGWPAMGGPYAEILQVSRKKLPNPDAGARVVLRNPAQYAQWCHFYASVRDWPEAESIARITCPRFIYFGGDGDLVEAGTAIRIASINRVHRQELEGLGWEVLEIPGHGHGVTLLPGLVVPPVRAFLDRQLPAQAKSRT